MFSSGKIISSLLSLSVYSLFFIYLCVYVDMYVFMNTYPILAWFFLQAGLGSKDVKGVSRHRRGEGAFQISKLFTADSSSKRLVI